MNTYNKQKMMIDFDLICIIGYVICGIIFISGFAYGYYKCIRETN